MSRSQLIVRKPAYKPWQGYRIFARKMPRNQQPPVIERSLLNRWEYVPNKESKTLISSDGPEFVKPRSGITISWMHKYAVACWLCRNTVGAVSSTDYPLHQIIIRIRRPKNNASPCHSDDRRYVRFLASEVSQLGLLPPFF